MKGDCDILLLVVLVASCSSSDPRQSNLLPPTPGQDGAAGMGPTRRPGDPGTEATADAGQLAVDGGAVSPAPDAPPATAPDAAPVADVATAPPPPPPPPPDASPPPDAIAVVDAAPLVDVGVTWDANQLLTDCGITKPWAPKKSYPKYEFALNYGHIFQCLGEPPNQAAPSPFSDCKSPDYEPGRPGGPWAAAWFDSGVCR